MRISIVGTHGIPGYYGGFETFAEHLAVYCAKHGHQVCVVNEKNHPDVEVTGVEIKKSEFNKGESPLNYYRDSLKLCSDSEIILSCGVGGSRYYKETKKSGAKIITNVDGLEHHRRRYSVLQRAF